MKTMCIRCLCWTCYCECQGGPVVTRHPRTCGCAGCEIGRDPMGRRYRAESNAD